jgi:hypothetical protein
MKITPDYAHTQIAQMLARLPVEIAGTYRLFHDRHRELMLQMPASVGRHHSFPGGYAVHIYEVMRNILALREFLVFPGDKQPTVGDAIIVAYIHDLDKLFWRYEIDTEKPTPAQASYARSLGIPPWEHETKATISKKIDAAKNNLPAPTGAELSVHRYRKDCLSMDDGAAVACLVSEHALPGVTREIFHAVCLTHGGWSPLAKVGSVTLTPLATIAHAADLASANIQGGEQ